MKRKKCDRCQARVSKTESLVECGHRFCKGCRKLFERRVKMKGKPDIFFLFEYIFMCPVCDHITRDD